MDKVVILMRKAPYGSVYTSEGFRTIMGLAVFEMDLNILYMDDGVFTLVKDQKPEKLDMKPLGEGFSMLAEMNVKKFYVHKGSLADRGLSLDDLVMKVDQLDDAGVAEVLSSATKILPF
jgi:tRNA 2-thiouridine synthesizing protein C